MRRERGTGSLKVRKGIFWLRYYHAGTRVEESSGIRRTCACTGRREEHCHDPNHKKALKALRAKTKAADTPQYVPPAAHRLRVDDLADLLCRDFARRQNRTAWRFGTAQRPRGPLHHVCAHFVGWRALAITTEHVERYADARLAAGASPATVNRELQVLRRMFKLAIQKNMLPRTPHVALRPEDNVRQGFIEIGDLDSLLAALRQRDPVAADVTEAAFCTCLRRGNLRALTWPQFVLKLDHTGTVIGGELRLPGRVTKNKKPLALPLTDRLLALIARRYAQRNGPHVFQRAGRPLHKFPATWRAATAAVSQPGLLFHDLRRSGARALRRAGVPETVIMKLGGWKTRSVFERYNITDDRDLADAQAALTAAFATARPTLVPLHRQAAVETSGTPGPTLGTPDTK